MKRLLLALTLCAAPHLAPAAGDVHKTRELIAVIEARDAGLHERARACQELTILGTEQAVPVLARLLADEKLGHYAREALEAMPYPVAGDALRAALGTLAGKPLIGVIHSVGLRRDEKAVGALRDLVARPDTFTAALLALGRIGTPEATTLLQRTVATSPDEPVRAAAAEGCLRIADAFLARRGSASLPPERKAVPPPSDPAVVLYDFVRHANVPATLRVTATRGAILARGAAGLPLLVEQLRSSDPALRDIALLTLRELPGADVTRTILTELDRAESALQVALLSALVDRNDPGALPAIEARAQSGSAGVRLAALQALGRVGANSSLPVLLAALRSPDAADAAAALASLARIKAADTDATILKTLPTVGPAMRAKLITALGDRQAAAALPELMKLAHDPDAETGKAALRAVGSIARPADQPELIRLALSLQDDERRTLADRAIATTAMKVLEVARRADAVLDAFRAATDVAAKEALLRPLGAIVRSMGTSHEAFFTVRAALADKSGQVREAALRSLADWPDAAPSVTLLELAARPDTTPAHREIALRGALRMAGNVAAGRDRSPLEIVAFLTDAQQLVRAKEEKLMLVSALGSVRRVEAIPLLQPYLDDSAVRTEAALALVQIAPALLGSTHDAETKKLLERIAASEKDEDTRRKAARAAKGLPAGAPKQKGKAAAAAAPPSAATESPRQGPLFNGRDLTGWEGNPGVWRVRDGVIVGGSLEGNPRNEFLVTTRSYGNFVLRLDYKLTGTQGFVNGGVQVRSVRIPEPPNEMLGYQADIGAGHSGKLYDESRRKKFLAEPAADLIRRIEKSGDWNRYEIRCEGPRVELMLNGEKTVSYTETDSGVAPEGLIALQIHGSCKAEIAFREIVLEVLP